MDVDWVPTVLTWENVFPSRRQEIRDKLSVE